MLAVPDGVFMPAIRPGRNAPAASPIPSTRGRGRYLPVAAAFAVCLLVAGWGMSLPAITDTVYGFAIVAASANPRPSCCRRIPTSYDAGADVATLQLEDPNDGDGQSKWRIYRFNQPGPSG